jgi:hypothetical protein
MKKKVLSHVRFLNLHYTAKEAINKRLKEKALAKILIPSYSDLLITIISQRGQTPLRDAGDQYLSLVTSRKLRSVQNGGWWVSKWRGEYGSLSARRRDFHRSHD